MAVYTAINYGLLRESVRNNRRAGEDTKRIIDNSERYTKEILRARLVFEPPSNPAIKREDARVTVLLPTMNVGHGDATEIHSQARLVIGPPPDAGRLHDWIAEGKKWRQEPLIGPGQRQALQVNLIFPLNQREDLFKKFTNGSLSFTMAAEVRYMDQFGSSYVRGTCAVYDPDPLALASQQWTDCEGGNYEKKNELAK